MMFLGARPPSIARWDCRDEQKRVAFRGLVVAAGRAGCEP